MIMTLWLLAGLLCPLGLASDGTEVPGRTECALRHHQRGETATALEILAGAQDERSRLLRFRLHLLREDTTGASTEANSWLTGDRGHRSDLLWTLSTDPVFHPLLRAEATWSLDGDLDAVIRERTALAPRHASGADALLLDIAGRLAARGDLDAATRILDRVDMVPFRHEWRIWSVRAVIATWRGDLQQLDRVLELLRSTCERGEPLAETYRSVSRAHPSPSRRLAFALAADLAGSGPCMNR